jgi:hypothetical protein
VKIAPARPFAFTPMVSKLKVPVEIGARQSIQIHRRQAPLKKPTCDYLKRNLCVTMAGQCYDVPLVAALTSMGYYRALFSVDYLYENADIVGRSLDSAVIDRT